MDYLYMFFLYLTNALLTVQLALVLLSIRQWRIGLLLALINAVADLLVKDVLLPHYPFLEGLHLITGLASLVIGSLYFLRLKIGGAILMALLTYILSMIGEVVPLLAVTLIFGKEMLLSPDNKVFLINCVLFGEVIVLGIPLAYLKMKKINLYTVDIPRY